MKKQNIPVGISAFSEIRRNGYYYVDKSGLISELLETEAVKVTLITRPGRFGKTLAMNMLADFLDIEKNSRILFEGLEISEKTELCEKWMNRCPTIFLSFKDVDGILRELDAFDRREEMKLWYDGYRFGNTDVYCPWDVMNYANALVSDPLAKPSGYWKNTSDNAIIRSFIDHAGSNITKKLETLLAGGMIVQKIEEELTYDYLHSSEDNLWSILYLTGYLTKNDGAARDALIPAGMSALKIPNAEIREIFETTLMKWFDDSAKEWNRKALFEAVWNGNSEGLTEEMSRFLRRTISYHDYREHGEGRSAGR